MHINMLSSSVQWGVSLALSVVMYGGDKLIDDRLFFSKCVRVCVCVFECVCLDVDDRLFSSGKDRLWRHSNDRLSVRLQDKCRIKTPSPYHRTPLGLQSLHQTDTHTVQTQTRSHPQINTHIHGCIAHIHGCIAHIPLKTKTYTLVYALTIMNRSRSHTHICANVCHMSLHEIVLRT